MAATKSSLKAAIIAKLSAIFNIVDPGVLDQFADAIAEAVVDEIKKGEVTVPGGSSSGTYPVN